MKLNATWDIHSNDYKKLVRSIEDTEPSATDKFTEFKSFFDRKTCKGRVINDLSWHPFWTGVCATAYTKMPRCDRLVAQKSIKVFAFFFFFSLLSSSDKTL